MSRSLTEEILTVLRSGNVDRGPMSLAHLSRRFGVSSGVMASCARAMVDDGLAEPSMVAQHGVITLHGLMRQVQPQS
jgi:hypothetical protein